MAVFSDSQLRPLVEKECDERPSSWYINCTPGGTFYDIASEMEACEIPVMPKKVVLLVGTNDMSRHMVMRKARASFVNLMSTVQEKFVSADVSFSCVTLANFYCLEPDVKKLNIFSLLNKDNTLIQIAHVLYISV